MDLNVDNGLTVGAVMMVVRRDKVLALEAAGYADLAAKRPMPADAIFDIRSISKPITVSGALLLVDDGKLRLDDPLAKFLPEFSRPRVKGETQPAGVRITIRQLMTHTSGIAAERPPELENITRTFDHTLAEVVARVAQQPLDFKPGSKWSYSSSGIAVLGRVMEVVSGQPFEAFMQQRVFEPLEMQDSSFFTNRAKRDRIPAMYNSENRHLVKDVMDVTRLGQKYSAPDFGLFSTAEDLRRFLSHEPISARPDTVPYRLSKFVRRHRGGVVVGALVAIGLVSTSALALFQMANARHQRDVARSELRRADAANDFSSLMLEEVGQGGKLLSREQLLDRGVQLLDARYGGDRAFVADMLTQLADRYGDAERNDMAIDLTKRAISIARQAGDPSLLAMTLCEGAHQEVQGETHPDVDAWLNEAKMLIAPLGEVPLRVSVTCLLARATRATEAGEWDQAIPMLMEAHALQVADGVQTGLPYTSVLNDLGGIYFNQGRFLEAYRMIAEVGAAFDRGGRGGTVGRSIIHENAASALVRMGEPQAALIELEGGHFLTGGRVSEGEVPLGVRPLLSLTLRRLGHLQEARDIIAGVADQMMAADNPTVASNALIQEGAILIELGHPDSARPLLERAVDIMSRNPNARAGALAQAQGLLADLETGIGQPEAAHRRLDTFLNSMGYSQDRSKLILEPALVSAARAMLALGDLARGESYANDALEIAERTARARDSSADVGEVLMLLARLRIAGHRPQEAKPLLERATQCFGNGLGTDAPLTDVARKMLRSIPAV